MRRQAISYSAWVLSLSLLALCGARPAFAQVFMSEAEALKIISPRAEWAEEAKMLDEQARAALLEKTRLRFPETTCRFHVARSGGQTVGYALTLDEIGKSEPITFTVGLDPGGKVAEVILLVFRESRGGEVRDKRFLKQFKGKSASDPIQVNDDILNYSGATLSSKAIARGVRRAIALFHHFYGSGAGREVSLGTKPPCAPEESINTRRRVRDASDVGANVHYIQARYLMGTVCAVELYAPNRERAERAANAAFDAMRNVERRMSSYLPESELSRLNRNTRAGDAVEVSKELFEVLDFSRRVSGASDGAFDITVAPLLRAWGFLPAFAEGGMGDGESDDKPSFASRRERPPVRATVGYRNIRLNPRTRTVRFMRPGVEIDLGGIAKGYAVDKAIEALREQGVRRARISTGGSTLYALGTPPDQPAGWSITLPTGETLLVCDAAVSSSGHSEHYVEISGRRYSHIFDPQFGEPVASDIATVSVLAPTAMESDALTKPFFILGGREQESLLRRFPGSGVYIGRVAKHSTASAPRLAGSKEAP